MQGSWTSWIGLAVGPLTWALSTQANYALAALDCHLRWPLVSTIALCLAVAAVGAGGVSFAAWRRNGQTLAMRFVTGLSAGTGILFAAVVFMQAAATLFLTGCER
jgi:hypothetical protein